MQKTILIVDDSTSLRQILKMALESAGYCVVEAIDGISGLAELDRHDVDMAICDINMPRMNGMEFIRAAKSKSCYKFLPVLMLTTESQTSKKEESKAAGARAWMTKPFAPSALIGAVSKLLPH